MKGHPGKGEDPRPTAAYKEVKELVDLLGLRKDAIALHYYGWNYLGWDITDSD